MRHFSLRGDKFLTDKFWIDEATDRVPRATAASDRAVVSVWLNRQPVSAERSGGWLVLGQLREGDVVLVQYRPGRRPD